MEISPITTVRIAPVIRSRKNDLALTEVFELEGSSRTDDETYSPGGNKSASGFEDDEEMAGEQAEADSEAEAKSISGQAAEDTTREISFFA